jgi:hypothetical protein
LAALFEFAGLKAGRNGDFRKKGGIFRAFFGVIEWSGEVKNAVTSCPWPGPCHLGGETTIDWKGWELTLGEGMRSAVAIVKALNARRSLRDGAVDVDDVGTGTRRIGEISPREFAFVSFVESLRESNRALLLRLGWLVSMGSLKTAKVGADEFGTRTIGFGSWIRCE